jgi:xanthine dehydrogenase accessory factor
MLRGEVAERAEAELSDEGAPFVEATVVRAQSPTSVRAGDSAIVHRDGRIEGFVGGACAETSVRLYALRMLDSGEPLLLRILPGDAAGEAATEDGAITVKNPCLSGGALEIFLEPRLPAATLRVVGETPIALALADLGRGVGYAVEQGPAEGSVPHADDAAVVVASHGHEEERVLTAALSEGVPYVGLVASKIRGDAVRGSLDLPEDVLAQLHTPAGLEIGAHSPGEIALAILAEIVSLKGDGAERTERANGRSAAVPKAGDGGAPAPAAPVKAAPAKKTKTSKPAPAQTATEVAIDPICGMEVAVSEASIHLERDGETFYFCREDCRDAFVTKEASGAGVS